MSIARDFGPPRHIIFGKIISVDESRIPHSYHCNYTNGDEEDMARDELLDGYELFGAMALGTYKPVQALVCDGSSEEISASEDAWSDDSDHELKVKRRATQKQERKPKTCKRKTSPALSRGDLAASPKKKVKTTALKDAGTRVQKLSVKSSFTV